MSIAPTVFQANLPALPSIEDSMPMPKARFDNAGTSTNNATPAASNSQTETIKTEAPPPPPPPMPSSTNPPPPPVQPPPAASAPKAKIVTEDEWIQQQEIVVVCLQLFVMQEVPKN